MTTERSKELERHPWLHIYAQAFWHEDAIIKGNRVALESLRNAIDDALATGSAGRCEAFVKDGEGYHVIVELKTYEDLDRDPLPYTHEMANPGR